MIISLNRRKIGLVAILLVLIALVSIIYYIAVGKRHMAVMNVNEYNCDFTLVIDAGHGGADGGATSVTGITESVTNLEIAQKLEMLAAFYGIPAIMTRDSEEIDYPSDANSIRAKKVYDTKNRVDTINNIDNAVLISIHQNIYDSTSVSGPQVIYASTSGSQEFAQAIQTTLLDTLQPSKSREPAKVSGDVYVMNHISCPAVLVECGFISNYQDDELLQSDSYQVKIAASLLSSFLNSQEALSGRVTNE